MDKFTIDEIVAGMQKHLTNKPTGSSIEKMVECDAPVPAFDDDVDEIHEHTDIIK